MTDLFDNETPDFTNPLGLLRACHDRILAQCETLEKLVTHLRSNDVDAEAKTAAQRVHRYFSEAAPLHHQDEEVDLFPVLQRQSLKMADLVYSLKQEHPELDAAWEQLAPTLVRLDQLQDIDDFSGQVADFCERYRKHVKRENDELLEIAQHILSSKQQAALGEAMEERRRPQIRGEGET